MTHAEQLEGLRDQALAANDDATRVECIDAADRLIGELKQAGEMGYREADHMAREWVTEYVARRGLLASLWQHDSAKAVLPRDVRAALISDVSRRCVGGE
jgi:hypothetical protein